MTSDDTTGPGSALDRMGEADGLPAPLRHYVMACVLLGAVLTNLDSAIANIALPTIAGVFRTSEAAAVWVVNSYQLAVTICLLPAAAFGEIIGLKRVYVFGLVVFTAASLLCALSPTLDVLVGARLIQGTGGACVAALAPAMIRTVYPRRIMGQGFALIALAVAISSALGPTIAALILSVASWPWLFLVNVPLCLVVVPLFWAVAPPSLPQPRPFDVSGALLNAVALGLLVTGVGVLGGSASRWGLGAILVGLVGCGLLVRQQLGRSAPLLPLDLLRIPAFGLSACTSVCSYSAQIMAYIALPFLFQTTMHRSAVATGLLVTPWPLLVAVAAPVAGRLAARYPASILGCVGLGILATGLLLLMALSAMPTDWDIVWRMGLCGIGFGFFQTPNNTLLMTTGPIARSAAASGMVAVARTVGWCLGSALVAWIFAVRGAGGTVLCLGVAAGFAAAGAAISLTRGSGRR